MDTAKKTYNVWRNDPRFKSSTGPWKYLYQLRASDEETAFLLARAISGLAYEYKVYEDLVEVA